MQTGAAVVVYAVVVTVRDVAVVVAPTARRHTNALVPVQGTVVHTSLVCGTVSREEV